MLGCEGCNPTRTGCIKGYHPKDYSYPKVVFSVKRGIASVAAAELLQHFPVADLNIEEVPIEDIIREVFTGKDIA